MRRVLARMGVVLVVLGMLLVGVSAAKGERLTWSLEFSEATSFPNQKLVVVALRVTALACARTTLL